MHITRLKHRLALKWFAQERRIRESDQQFGPTSTLARSRATKHRKNSKAGKQHLDLESVNSSPPPRHAAKAAAIKPAEQKIKIEIQSHNNIKRPEAKKRVHSGSFKSPKAMGVNTISLNFGKRGDVQGQFVSESPPPASKRELKAKLNHRAQSKKSKLNKNNNKNDKDKLNDNNSNKTLNSEEDESEDSDFLRHEHFRRRCCHEAKISDH